MRKANNLYQLMDDIARKLNNVLCYVLIIVSKSKVQIKVHCVGKVLKRLLYVVKSISSA